MRCDLHVHTRHSGMCDIPLFSRFCRESYNDPAALYETLKRRGMGLVTVTDHDSIDAAEELRRHPEFFLSEEVTVTTPAGAEFHMGVYGITERDHVELQRRRADLESLVAYLEHRRLMYGINHAFSSLTGRRAAEDFDWFRRFPLVEVRNGEMPEATNRVAASFAGAARGLTAGSDAHVLSGAGRTWTEVPGARTAAEFLAGLRAGSARIHGESGNWWKLTRAVLAIGGHMMREHPWTVALAPLAVAVPAVILGHTLRERWFARRWALALQSTVRVAPQPYNLSPEYD